MAKKLELTGQRFGQLVVLELVDERSIGYHTRWKCKCDCGSIHVARGALLVDGSTTRCRQCAARAAIETRTQEKPEATVAIYKAVLDLYATNPSDDLKHILNLCHDAIQ